MNLESIEARLAEMQRVFEAESSCTLSQGAASLALTMALEDVPVLITLLRVIRQRAGLEAGVSLCPMNPLDVHAKGLGPEHCVSCLRGRQEKLVEMLRRVEWSAGCSSGCCETRGSCPICRANSPDAMKKHGTPREEKPWRWGPGNGEHQNDCALAALLKEK